MDIRKVSKPPASELVQESNSQSESQSSEQRLGITETDSVEQVVNSNVRSNIFAPPDSAETTPQDEALAVYKPSGGPTQMGQPKTDSSLVSQSYAATQETLQVADQSNTYSAIRQEIADALNVLESDPAVDREYQDLIVRQREQMEARNIAQHQAIIDAARTFGRRTEEALKIGNKDVRMFDEFLPGKNSWETQIGDMDVFLRRGLEITEGDKTVRDVKYFDNKGNQLGIVESVIKDGIETITKVKEYVPGSIALNPGDTRTVPQPSNTPAGTVPSTWDPQPDGQYGTAGGGTNTSSDDGGAQSLSGGGGKMDEAVHQHFYKGSAGSGSGAPADESSGRKVHVYHSDDGGKTWEDKGVQSTEDPPTQVTVEEPETDEGLAEEAEVNQNDDDRQATDDYYSNPGPTPEPQQGVIRQASESGSYTSSSRSVTTFTDTSGGKIDPEGAPINYGNPYDPFTTFEALSPDSTPPNQDPTVTDPVPFDEGGDSAATGGIRLDMVGTLRDGVNPADPFANEAPAGERPSTSEAERTALSDDDPFRP